jgi:hypothetical protein
MANYVIDKLNRRIILEKATLNETDNIINEFDRLDKFFLEGTEDRYECELVLIDVEGELKAFARRVGNEKWLMEFEVEKYNKM